MSSQLLPHAADSRQTSSRVVRIFAAIVSAAFLAYPASAQFPASTQSNVQLPNPAPASVQPQPHSKPDAPLLAESAKGHATPVPPIANSADSPAAHSPAEKTAFAPAPAVEPASPLVGVPHDKLILIQDVQVWAHDSHAVTPADGGISSVVDAGEVEATAGAYNDIPKFLQTLPGVAFDTDARNTYLVNGGNATENLYRLDGVEIPNINHISSSVSSAGFVSIIDTGAVSSITLHRQLYGSEYSGSLSSVLDIHTLQPDVERTHGNVSVGYAGAGFLLEQPLGHHGVMMTQIRKSVDNYFTNDIGIDGVPKYMSLLSTSVFALNDRDSIKTLVLQAFDSLDIRPNLLDGDDPGLLNTGYTGRHGTGAVTWHHMAPAGTNDLQFNYSNVVTATTQTNPYQGNAPVYSDQLNELPVTVRYDLSRQYSRIGFQAGSVASTHQLNYSIDQASGYPSPYSIDPTPVDSSNVALSRHPLNDAAYGEFNLLAFGSLQLQGGLRYERWGINGSSAWMPRADFKLNFSDHSFFFGGIGGYSQMPSLPVMLGVAQNISLKPIRDVQTQIGASFGNDAGDVFQASIYGRHYTSYPVSTQFPTLSLADMVDPFGQPSLYMPMVSAGTGTVSGVEAQVKTNTDRRLFLQINFTNQTVLHRALDGVARSASYDMPIIANILGGIHIARRQLLTGRYSYHTGVPYTPFLLDLSEQQHREIYDLSQVDALRGPAYARIDLRYEITRRVHNHDLKIYMGVENLTNRSNFYQYVLLPQDYSYGPYPLTQMGRYPDAGVAWAF